MSKETSSFENRESRDLRARVVEALKSDSPDAKDLFLQWRILREQEADTLNTSNANVKLDIEQAKILMEAKFFDDAWDMLQDIRQLVNSQNETDLFLEIDRLMDEIEKTASEE
ncbi:MAG: hypothetical protein M1320_01125 [Patescibacteria group bacterium]|nr:hypothetical protein [Patescibacteria group bacterium]